MEDFLPMLRRTNLFNRNAATDRPFGMPDQNDDFAGFLHREIAPLADQFNRDDLQRRKELMQFEASMRPAPKAQLPTNNLIKTKKNVVLGAPQGFSPMQKIFQAEKAAGDEFARRREMQDTDISAKLQLGRERTDAENAQLARELSSRESIANSRNQADAARYAADRSGRLEVERVRGEEARRTQAAKPVTEKVDDDAYNKKIERMFIERPDLARYIDGGGDTPYKVKSIGSDEESNKIAQQEIIAYLNGKPSPNLPKTPDAPPLPRNFGRNDRLPIREHRQEFNTDISRTMTRTLRNKSGQTKQQISKDGGKTWSDK